MKRKPTVVIATSLSLALLAMSTAFAVANGVFGSRRSDRVGTFQEINARLAPSTHPVAKRHGEAALSTATHATTVTTGDDGTAPAVGDEVPVPAAPPGRAEPASTRQPTAGPTPISTKPPSDDPPVTTKPEPPEPPESTTTIPQRHHDDDDHADDGRGSDD